MPEVGEHRIIDNKSYVWIPVDGELQWRETYVQRKHDYFCSKDGMKELPYGEIVPILGEGERVIEKLGAGCVGIVSDRTLHLTPSPKSARITS